MTTSQQIIDLTNTLQSLPVDHPDIGIYGIKLAKVYESTKQKESALYMYNEMYNFQCKVLPDDHPDLDTTRLLFSRYLKTESFEELCLKPESIKQLAERVKNLESERIIPLGNYPDNDTLYKIKQEQNIYTFPSELTDETYTSPMPVKNHRLEMSTFKHPEKNPHVLLDLIYTNLELISGLVLLKRPECFKVLGFVPAEVAWNLFGSESCTFVMTLFANGEDYVVEPMRTSGCTLCFNKICTHLFKSLGLHK